MVENCGIGCRCSGDPSIRQRTTCGTARPSYLARTIARVQCHRSGSIGLEASANQFADRLDIRGVRRRAILPRLFTHARSRRLGTINPGLLDRHDPCFIAFRLWSLLQRPLGRARQHLFWLGAWRRLSGSWPKSLGSRANTRNRRHHCNLCRFYELDKVA